MPTSYSRSVFILIVGTLLSAAVGTAQTDVALSIYGAFSGTTNGNDIQQSPSNAAGGIFELRHIRNPILGFEGTYSFNRANQTYTPTVSCGLICGPVTSTTVSNDAHQVTVDWVPSIKVANFRPFGVLGAGVLLNQPAGNQTNTQSSDKAVYVYGAGIDWGLLPHLGLRLQYRGNLYKAPDVSRLYTSADEFTRTSEPMIGVYFRL